MSENPFEAIRKACDSVGNCFKTHLSKASSVAGNSKASIFSFFTELKPGAVNDAALLPSTSDLEKKITAAPLTKEELGRATWTLLHTVAAQFPDSPTRQQKKDVRELMAILSRIYPCKECADHFKEVLKPSSFDSMYFYVMDEKDWKEKSLNVIWVEVVHDEEIAVKLAESQAEFSQWLCHVHNIVNRSLGKQLFSCQRVNARWGKLDCLDRSCDLEGSNSLSFPL